MTVCRVRAFGPLNASPSRCAALLAAAAVAGPLSPARAQPYVSASLSTTATYGLGNPSSVSNSQSFYNTTASSMNTPTTLGASLTYGTGSAVANATASQGHLHVDVSATQAQNGTSDRAATSCDLIAVDSGYFTFPGAADGTLVTMEFRIGAGGRGFWDSLNPHAQASALATWSIDYVSDGGKANLTLYFPFQNGPQPLGYITATVGSPIDITMSLRAQADVTAYPARDTLDPTGAGVAYDAYLTVEPVTPGATFVAASGHNYVVPEPSVAWGIGVGAFLLRRLRR